jgi:hypothetical protein
LEYSKEPVDKPVLELYMFFFIIPKPVRSFEKWSKVSLACLFSIDLVIFVFQEGVISPEETFNLIWIEKF